MKNKQNTEIEKEVMAKSSCQFFIRAAEKFLKEEVTLDGCIKKKKTE